jgi:hypothetical protein
MGVKLIHSYGPLARGRRGRLVECELLDHSLFAKIPQKVLCHAQSSLSDCDGGRDMWHFLSFDSGISRCCDNVLDLVADFYSCIVKFKKFIVLPLQFLLQRLQWGNSKSQILPTRVISGGGSRRSLAASRGLGHGGMGD